MEFGSPQSVCEVVCCRGTLCCECGYCGNCDACTVVCVACVCAARIKHIGPPGLPFLTSMLKTALNTNIIPHIWNLADIVLIQKKREKKT